MLYSCSGECCPYILYLVGNSRFDTSKCKKSGSKIWLLQNCRSGKYSCSLWFSECSLNNIIKQTNSVEKVTWTFGMALLLCMEKWFLTCLCSETAKKLHFRMTICSLMLYSFTLYNTFNQFIYIKLSNSNSTSKAAKAEAEGFISLQEARGLQDRLSARKTLFKLKS